MFSIKQFINDIKESKAIAIIGHKEPDADALASAMAMKRLIKNNMHQERIIDLYVDCDNIDEIYEPIIKDEYFGNCARFPSYDLVICLDSSNLSRIGKFEFVFKNSKKTINIDHHESNERYADRNYIYTCSSTCELIYIIAKALNLECSKDTLKMLYAGIITDTVNLTQGTVKVSTYKTITDIVTKVNDMPALEAIKDHFLKNKTRSNAVLLEKALHSMVFYLNDRVAIMKITKTDMIDADATQSDTVGIVNNAINLKGVDIAILFIKQEDDSYYVSVRGKNGVNVTQIAVAYNGGGHETVAAFSYNGKLSDIKEGLLNICEEVLKDIPSESESMSLFD